MERLVKKKEDREGEEDCIGHDSETLYLSVAAGCEAQSEGIDDKMSFWIWSESFLNLIPPGLAPEIQIWHVAGRQKRKKISRAIKSAPVKEEEGGAVI